MNAAVAANRRFLDTTSSEAAREWDQLLAYQADLLFADELRQLRSLPEWIAAGHVIDAGCGNGYYLAKLAAFFPNKRSISGSTSRPSTPRRRGAGIRKSRSARAISSRSTCRGPTSW